MFFLNYSYVLISSFFTAPAMCRPVFSNFAFAEQKNASEAAPQGVLRGWGDRGGIGGRGEGGGGENFLGKHINRLFFISRIGKLVFPLL